MDLRNQIGPVFDIVYQAVPASGVPASEAGVRIDALLTAKGFKNYFEPNSKDMTKLAMIDQWVLGERRAIDYSEEDKKFWPSVSELCIPPTISITGGMV